MTNTTKEAYIKLVEEISLNAWPSHKIELYDGWLIRFSHNYTHRTNSVTQVGTSLLPIEEKIHYCEAVYANYHTPSIFKISPLIDPSFDELLAGKGVGERKVTVGIRPEHIAFAAAPGTDTVSSKVDVSEMMGSEVYLHVNAVGRDVVLRIPTTDLPAEHRAGIPYGTEINFAFRPELIHLFDPETEKNLMY